MIKQRVIFVVVVIMSFLMGLVSAIVVIAPGDRTEFWEISSNFRKDEVDAMFSDYKAGRIIYTAMLPVLGTRVKVRVVNNRLRGGDYGFIPLSELGDVPTHLWYYRVGEFELKKYDKETLFVDINDHYVNDIQRNPSKSGYSPVPVSGDEGG